MADYLIVPGAQVTLDERRFFRNIASQYNRTSATIVNIGIMWGCTLWCLRDGAQYAKLYGVDLTPDKWQITERENLHATILQGDSRTLEFEDEIDVLLIDGDHHYDVVKADIENWIGRVKKGGSVIFHDYAPTELNMRQFPELEGVKRAVDEWSAANPQWKLIGTADSAIGFKYAN